MINPTCPRRLAIALAVAGASAPTFAAEDQGWKTFADVGAIGIPAAAIGIIALEKDHNGLEQFAKTMVLTVATTEGLRYAIDSERPNGGRHSFPSLHSSAAFGAAGFLHARYGWRTGLPFELLAVGVGVARVQSRDHHWYDVLGGAAIGEGSAWLFTRRLREDVAVSVTGDSTGGIVALSARF